MIPMEDLIAIDEFCAHQQIDFSFIRSLSEFGLIEVITSTEAMFISSSQLPQLEKIIRLHYDLDINLEGIETILHMLQQINNLQEEVDILKNRLRVYE
jgi:hypothetical protein